MAKLRKIKSGSALSPPDNREIAQKQMRSRYIRTIKRKRKTSVATIPISMKSGSNNTTIKPVTGTPNYVRSSNKAPEKVRTEAEKARFYDTYNYTGGRKLVAGRREKLVRERKRNTMRNTGFVAGARIMNTTIQHGTSEISDRPGSRPDDYANERVSIVGQQTAYRSVGAVRSASRGLQRKIRVFRSLSSLARGGLLNGIPFGSTTSAGGANLTHESSVVRRMNPVGRQQIAQATKHAQSGFKGMLQSASRTIKTMVEASKSTEIAISIAGIGSSMVFIIISVVLVLAMTISSAFGEYNLDLSENDFVNIALSQVGTESGEEYCKWYGFDHEVGWCAIFVSWCGTEAGLVKKDLMPKFAWVPTGVYWFQNRNQWHANDYTPKPGDIIFFDWYDYELDEDGEEIGQDGQADHVGIVERVEAGRVYTVEGNTTVEGICAEKRYPLGYFEILGYGEVLYPER